MIAIVLQIMTGLQALLADARHKSVTKKRLTELKGGLTTRYLYEKPLIEYLESGEQPHFILAARQTAPTFSGTEPPTWSGQNHLRGMAMHMVTDQRWLMVCGMKGGDGQYSVPVREIAVTDHSTGVSGHEIHLLTPKHKISIPIGNMYDSDEVDAVVKYVREIDGMTEEEIRKQWLAGKYADGVRGVRMVAAGENGQVLLFDEKIRITRKDIGTVHEINHLRSGEKEIRVDNITSIQLKEPSTFAKGYIQFGQSGHTESDDGTFDEASDENSVLFTDEQTDKFIELRDEIEKLQQRHKGAAATTESEVDPTEQLKNIKELHDSGVLSDEEFEEKKQDLLDQI